MNMVLLCGIFAWAALLSSVASRPSWTLSTRQNRRFVPWISRGGGDGVEHYSVVGIIPGSRHQDADGSLLETALARNCCLVRLDQSPPQLSCSLPKDAQMLESLSMTCPLLVLSIDPSLSSTDATPIVEGALRRHFAGSPKLKLVVVVPPGTSARTKEQLLLGDFASITPEYFDEFELVDDLESVWINLADDAPKEEASLIDQQGLVPLIQVVYEALSSKSCNIHLEEYKELQDESQVDETQTPSEESSSELAQRVLSDAQPELDQLEAKLQDVWLSSDASTPMLDFGSEANAILQHAFDAAKGRTDVLLLVCAKVKRLYDQQLQSLREHYGRRYEAVLDRTDDEEEWTGEAERVTEAFRAAAQHAVPEKCRDGGALRDADFSYVNELQGLISDMMEATSMRQELSAAVEPQGEEEPPCVAKWYEKLAARALVIGVNYLQGWMAWQAIERAAVERDRAMPKFPLF